MSQISLINKPLKNPTCYGADEERLVIDGRLLCGLPVMYWSPDGGRNYSAVVTTDFKNVAGGTEQTFKVDDSSLTGKLLTGTTQTDDVTATFGDGTSLTFKVDEEPLLPDTRFWAERTGYLVLDVVTYPNLRGMRSDELMMVCAELDGHARPGLQVFAGYKEIVNVTNELGFYVTQTDEGYTFEYQDHAFQGSRNPETGKRTVTLTTKKKIDDYAPPVGTVKQLENFDTSRFEAYFNRGKVELIWHRR